MTRRTLRVFPRRTSLTPVDDMAFIGEPPMIRPDADEVHVSCTFTWDMPRAERLEAAWRQYYPVVKLGGPAYGSPVNGFTPGKYVKDGVTFTSRGCNNHCDFCLVRPREGKLSLYETFHPGYIIQDNNLLQCPPDHIDRVFAMLRTQRRAAIFSGGIEAELVDAAFSYRLRTIRVHELFLACDTDDAIEPLRHAMRLLGWLGRDKCRCYVLIGRESLAEAEARLRAVWDAGCLPFAQCYQPPDNWIKYPSLWRDMARTWSRPAATKTLMKGQA